MKYFLLFIILIISNRTIMGQERLYRIETQDRKIGFINSNGKVIIKPRFDFLSNRSYHGYRWIHAGGKRHQGYIKGGKWGLIRLGAANDRMIVEPTFDWVGPFSEGLAPVLVKDQWGFMDTTGRMRIAPQFPDNGTPDFEPERMRTWNEQRIQENWFYDPNFPDHGHEIGDSSPPSWLFIFKNGSAWVKTKKGSVLIDTTGQITKTLTRAPFDYSYFFDFQAAVFKYENSYGVLDRQGDTIVPPQDKRITSIQYYQKNLNWIAVEISTDPPVSRWGLITADGQWRIEPQYEKVWIRDHLFWVQQDKLWELIDSDGKHLIEPQFDKIEHFYEYGMKVQRNKKWGLIDNSGKRIHECRWDELGYPNYGIAKIVENKKIGFIDRDGKILATPQFRHAEYPHNGFVWASTDSGWCVLNREGKIIVPANKKFQYVYGFGEGVAWFRYDNRYGLVDTAGQIIAEPSFEFRNPCSFTGGLGWVQNEGLWSLLKKNGETVFKIKCNGAGDFDGELALIWFDEKKQGYVNKQGKVVWEGD